MKDFLLEALKIALPLALAAAVYGGVLLIKRIRTKRGAGAAEQAAIEAACSAAKKLLDQTLFGAVTAAEKAWSPGTGAAKLDEVRKEMLALLPEELRLLVPADWLQRAIESTLAEAKKKWEQNQALLWE